LLAVGLLYLLRLYTFPIVLGGGKRLFDRKTPATALKLIDQIVSPGGTIIATYGPAEAIKTCSVADIGSAREAERQRRIRENCW
jgi:hypothetical protein